MRENNFYKKLWSIALPVTLQSLLQSSFSMIDQVMIGQLGAVSIAGIGLGGKLASMYSVVLGAIAAAAGIMIAQYVGQENDRDLQKSFSVNLLAAVLLAALFTILGVCMPGQLMGLYTKDAQPLDPRRNICAFMRRHLCRWQESRSCLYCCGVWMRRPCR